MLGNKMEQKRFTPGPKITARWQVANINWQSTSCNGHQLSSLSSSDCRLCFSRSASLPKPSAAPALEFSRWDHFPQIPLTRFIASFFFLSLTHPPPHFKRLNCYSTLQISPGLDSASSCRASACLPSVPFTFSCRNSVLRISSELS